MNLEEDAMLVAIGRMSMEEAREKWADDWAAFIQSLSRWKSIHQFLRLLRLNDMKQKLAAGIDDAQQRVIIWNNLRNEQETLRMLIDEEADAIWFRQQLLQDAQERFERRGKQPYDIIFGFDPRQPEEAPRTHRGKRIYQDHVRYAIEATRLEVEIKSLGGDEKLEQLRKECQENQKKLEEATKKVNKVSDELAQQRKELAQAQDQYDITKPYAMGLLVADIFYSLAAALQGDNY